ncbi:MAG: hypothetical protein JWM43_3058 [Acidobacteriaceae bacterium]|nr:hypothetical protein [Acidobacteriaceae bacterium]
MGLLRPAVRAQYLFHQLQTLQLDHSSFEEAQTLARKLGAEPHGPCDRSVCEWEAKVDNSRIPEWWRGSGAAFLVSFNVKDSVVVRKNTGYGIGKIGAFIPSQVGLVEEKQWGRGNTNEPVRAGWKTTELYRYFAFTVHMTPKATPEDRRRYTSYNYSCFWKYKGCRDARDLLPTADPFPENAFPERK